MFFYWWLQQVPSLLRRIMSDRSSICPGACPLMPCPSQTQTVSDSFQLKNLRDLMVPIGKIKLSSGPYYLHCIRCCKLFFVYRMCPFLLIGSSPNQKVGGSIPGSASLHAKVSLGKTLNPTLPPTIGVWMWNEWITDEQVGLQVEEAACH